MAYQRWQLSTIRTRLLEKVEAAPYWSNEEARLAINEALRVWNTLTGMWWTSASVITLANDPWHPLTGNMTRHMRVSFNGLPLEPCSLLEIDGHRPYWENETTTSGGDVPTTPKIWIPVGLQLLAIWPADAAGGNTLLVDGIVTTPVLVNDADYIDIGDEEFETLLGYALHVLAFKEGGARFAATQPLYQAFVASAMEKNDRLKLSNIFRRAMGIDAESAEQPAVSTKPG
jgi:hypothetical protein